MRIRVFSQEADNVFQKAGRISQKYYHSFCGSGHLFLALFSELANNTSDERYADVFTKLKNILNKNGITGKVFETEFLTVCPKGVAPADNEKLQIAIDSDYERIRKNLTKQCANESRTMEIEDLIAELFSDESYMLYTIIEGITKSQEKTDELYNEIVKTFRQVKIADFSELEELTQTELLLNVNKWVSEHPESIIGVDDTISQVEVALNGRSIRNALLVGPAGTGKTAVVHELAKRINEGNVSSYLKDKVIYELNTGALVAGTKYRGEMEERLINILSIVKKNPRIILFIDEAHTFLKAGAGSDEASGAGEIIKPYISRGELQIIMATTNDEYTKYILPNKAFARRFHECKVTEPTKDDMKQILEGILPVESKYFNKTIQSELVDKIIELSSKYSLELANPAKAINMLELACSYAKVFEEKKTEVELNAVIESVKLKYAIYISENKYEDTKKELFKELLGEDNALTQICKDLKTVEKGLYDPERPMFTMLLAGPTG